METARARGLDLTPEQWFVLNKLRTHPGANQTELCDTLLADKPDLSRMLRTMESRGWLVRQTDPSDARRQQVTLTNGSVAD